MSPIRRLARHDPEAAREQLKQIFREESGWMDRVAKRLGISERQTHDVIALLDMTSWFHLTRGESDYLLARMKERKQRWAPWGSRTRVATAAAASEEPKPCAPGRMAPDGLFDD